MATPTKDEIYNFRTNAVRLEQAKEILSEQNLDLPSILNSVINEIILTKKFSVRTKEEIDGDLFLSELQKALEFKFSNEFGDELEEIQNYIRENVLSEQSTKNIASKIVSQIQILKNFPELGIDFSDRVGRNMISWICDTNAYY